VAEWSGVKWLGFGPASGWRGIYKGPERGGSLGRVRLGKRARAPHIWAGYEGCRSSRKFEIRLRQPSVSKFRDWSVTGPATQAFEADLGCPVVAAFRATLTGRPKRSKICWKLPIEDGL
jgi:hypothetical protein